MDGVHKNNKKGFIYNEEDKRKTILIWSAYTEHNTRGIVLWFLDDVRMDQHQIDCVLLTNTYFKENFKY